MDLYINLILFKLVFSEFSIGLMLNQFLISRNLPTVILVFNFKYIILELRVKAKRKTLVVKSDSSDADFIVPDDEIESSESESEDLRESPKFSLADRIKVSHC